MGYVLRLKQDTALDILTQLSHDLFRDYGVKCKLIDDLSIHIGKTYMNDNGYATDVAIGMYEIKNPKTSLLHLFDPKIPDEDFVRVVLNMHHEYEHCVQKNYMFRQKILDAYTAKQLI